MTTLIILMVFISSYFLHMTSRVPVLGESRADLLLGVIILFLILISNQSEKFRASLPITRRLNIFLLYIAISLPLVTWPGSVIRFHLVDWLKVASFFIFLVAIIRTEKQLKWVMGVFLACQIFRIFEPLYLHLTTGYWGDVAHSQVGGTMSSLDRLSGAPHDVVNPNQLAWVIVTSVPFLFYILWQGSKLGKVVFLAIIPGCVYTLLLTGSRSGLLCLCFTVLAMVFLSRDRKRNAVVAAIILVPVAIYASGLLSGDMQTRYLSLVDSNVVGADTAQGRINGALRQLSSLAHNPLFGNGLGTSRETNWNIMGGSSQITHNLYIETLQEVGIVGFTLFILYIVSIIKSLSMAKQMLEMQGEMVDDWLCRLITATQVWIFMDLFYSLSCFGLSSWEWYFFGAVATLCYSFAAERSQCAYPLVEEGEALDLLTNTQRFEAPLN